MIFDIDGSLCEQPDANVLHRRLTSVEAGTFSVRFNVDGGAMVYRIHADTEDNPFSGGLFSQFRLSDTLY